MHHVAIATPNLYLMRDFYKTIPGLDLIQENQFSEGELRSAWFRVRGTESVLMLESEPFVRGPQALVFSIHLTGLSKDDIKDILFQNMGLTPDGETPFTLYFRDPDGNRLGYSDYVFS